MATTPTIDPIQICALDDIQRIRERAYQSHCDELLGCSELAALAVAEEVLEFPIEATFPNPPDVHLRSNQRTLAIEVTRVTWERQFQVIAEAKRSCSEFFVELDPDLRGDGPARRDKKAKGQRRGHFSKIKTIGERLDGSGSVGDEPERAALSALRVSIEKKRLKLITYQSYSPIVWLFLIDDGYPGAWHEILTRPELHKEAKALCEETGFQRLYLFQFSGRQLVRLDTAPTI